MQAALPVAVAHCQQRLVGELLRQRLSAAVRMSLQLVQYGMLAELEDQVQAPLAPENLEQSDQIRVLQVLCERWKFQYKINRSIHKDLNRCE